MKLLFFAVFFAFVIDFLKSTKTLKKPCIIKNLVFHSIIFKRKKDSIHSETYQRNSKITNWSQQMQIKESISKKLVESKKRTKIL